MASAAHAPEVLWAQRSNEHDAEKNVVMLTINAPNLPPPPATKLDLTATGLKFSATVAEDKSKAIEGKQYELSLDFFDEIDVENSKQSQSAKNIYLVLRKKKAQEEYWPRLTKEKARLHFLKTDFNKWVDEDEQNGAADDVAAGGAGGFGGMDEGMMGGFGGAGGAGGMDFASMLGGAGAGGAGGAGGLDLQKMLAEMGQAGGAGADGLDFDDDDEDDAGAEGAEGAAKEGEEAPAVESQLKNVESVD
ncbi:p23 chaperone protein wos2 [Tilletia horrida]|uniref:P23 chaperone protein wos2 n=1 Tax=Tilletia horrida TaxID=155126 RepID=A0AAN6GQQ1_9BASI|nr:p23 chaperone protein wos2 [Tilletia horrida]KAK0552805.1 p23 chaperone protein wos2 [Tilletia horrida]KAK0567283.1 p23 chaperone protein wos2 [Tilletia horrida]